MNSSTITVPLHERTVGSIVADDYRTAAVFNAHGIDFCCKGGRSVAEVCQAKGLDPAALEAEIRQATERDNGANDDVKRWPLGRLIEHIERVHHRYVESRSTTLLQFLDKLCKVHGDRHPELFDIQREFQECAGAMAAHMKKEELVLFPFINQLEKARLLDLPLPTPHFGTVDNPIAMMEHEHDAEGERFRRIAELSGNYTNPPDGCTTYATAYAMLHEFEEDLHRHIHLENNILFPKAKALEKELRLAQGCDSAAC
ncbi:MAG: iron-sulfur cluster repair di-iron protein [Flavobacteriales bacterium]|nr:iron-sulfur cluster repair di-iron protein [Flavobacteriales bacterium]